MATRQDTGATKKDRWLTPEKLVVAIIVPIFVAVLGVALTWWANRPETHIEVVSLTVEEGETVEGETPGEYEFVPPRVQVALRNVGDQVSVVTGAQLEVLDHAYFEICEAGGALVVSRTYDVLLPLDPEPGQVLNVDVAQELEPDKADLFEFAMQTPEPENVSGTHVYRLQISLTRDGGAEVLDAGVVIVGAPVLAVETLWVTAEELSYPGPVGDCYRQLRREYQRVQGWQGKKSQEFDAAPEDMLRSAPP